MMTINPAELSPEEHQAVFGDRADHRVKVWRQTYGPGERASGARFRDEVCVCTAGCGTVAPASRVSAGAPCLGHHPTKKVRWMDAVSGPALQRALKYKSDEWLKRLVAEPCKGILIPPTVEQGHFWLDGETFHIPRYKSLLPRWRVVASNLIKRRMT